MDNIHILLILIIDREECICERVHAHTCIVGGHVDDMIVR